jgi:hypothetical protein
MENSDYQLNNSHGDNYLLYNKKNNFSFFKKYKICLIFGFLLLICIIICVSIYLSKVNLLEKCEEGDEEKCLSCVENKCMDCNYGYKLIEGKCILNYSIKSIYFTSKDNTNIDLLYKDYLNNIVEMSIDGQNINPCTNYTFQVSGNHNDVLFMYIFNIYRFFQ